LRRLPVVPGSHVPQRVAQLETKASHAQTLALR
jgi:hypothetical protein